MDRVRWFLTVGLIYLFLLPLSYLMAGKAGLAAIWTGANIAFGLFLLWRRRDTRFTRASAWFVVAMIPAMILYPIVPRSGVETAILLFMNAAMFALDTPPRVFVHAED